MAAGIDTNTSQPSSSFSANHVTDQNGVTYQLAPSHTSAKFLRTELVASSSSGSHGSLRVALDPHSEAAVPIRVALEPSNSQIESGMLDTKAVNVRLLHPTDAVLASPRPSTAGPLDSTTSRDSEMHEPDSSGKSIPLQKGL